MQPTITLDAFQELLERVTRRADVAADIFRGPACRVLNVRNSVDGLETSAQQDDLILELVSMLELLYIHKIRITDDHSYNVFIFFVGLQGFVDLGSGRGHAVLVAHALFPFRQCVGHRAYAVSQGMLELCQTYADLSFDFLHGIFWFWPFEA